MGTPETLDRRERRRRQAVRAFLLDSLFTLDGVEYVHPEARQTPEAASLSGRERPSDAPGTPRAGADGSECAFCGGKGYTVVPDGQGCWDRELCECGGRDA